MEGDLFAAPKEYALAHCVAADLHMGAGIAVMFRNKFGRVATLKGQNAKVGGLAVLKDGKRTIYYLITKKLSTQKPKYSDLLCSLIALRKDMQSKGIKKLGIPKIGCGLDGLEWDRVYDLLHRVFNTDDVEIVLYTRSNAY